MVTCVLLAELSLFIFIAVYHDQGQSLVKQRLVSQMKTYNHIYPSQYEKSIDYIQSQVIMIDKKIISLIFFLLTLSTRQIIMM